MVRHGFDGGRADRCLAFAFHSRSELHASSGQPSRHAHPVRPVDRPHRGQPRRRPGDRPGCACVDRPRCRHELGDERRGDRGHGEEADPPASRGRDRASRGTGRPAATAAWRARRTSPGRPARRGRRAQRPDRGRAHRPADRRPDRVDRPGRLRLLQGRARDRAGGRPGQCPGAARPDLPAAQQARLDQDDLPRLRRWHRQRHGLARQRAQHPDHPAGVGPVRRRRGLQQRRAHLDPDGLAVGGRGLRALRRRRDDGRPRRGRDLPDQRGRQCVRLARPHHAQRCGTRRGLRRLRRRRLPQRLRCDQRRRLGRRRGRLRLPAAGLGVPAEARQLPQEHRRGGLPRGRAQPRARPRRQHHHRTGLRRRPRRLGADHGRRLRPPDQPVEQGRLRRRQQPAGRRRDHPGRNRLADRRGADRDRRRARRPEHDGVRHQPDRRRHLPARHLLRLDEHHGPFAGRLRRPRRQALAARRHRPARGQQRHPLDAGQPDDRQRHGRVRSRRA